jgi:hypothetical protein
MVLLASYDWMESSDRVGDLQVVLGLNADEVYGPNTRIAHLDENQSQGLAVDGIPSPVPTLGSFDTDLYAGVAFSLSGSGFRPESNIEVWLYSDPVLLTTVTVDSVGSFVASVDIPADTPEGDHTVQIGGETIDGDETEIVVPVTVALDVTGPVFGTAWVSAANVDVTSGPQTIDISFTATDDASGVRFLTLDVLGDGGWSTNVAIEGTCFGSGCSLAYLTSGTIQDGTWTATLEIPSGIPSQTVEVRFGGAPGDWAGNSGHSDLFPGGGSVDCVEAGTCPLLADFTITGPTE